MSSSPSSLDERELTKIFNRLADNYLLLDIPFAGTPEMINCCHGGCDNCDFSHIFDCKSAGRAKWVACYPTRRLIDGRTHVAPWARLFSSEEDIFSIQVGADAEPDDNKFNEIIDQETFIKRLCILPAQSSLGPAISISPDEGVSEEAVAGFWFKLCNTSEDGDTLTSKQMAQALSKITNESHGAMWSDIKKGFL